MSKRGFALMGLGVVLLGCALGLLVYNMWDENRANAAESVIMLGLREQIEANCSTLLLPDETAPSSLNPESSDEAAASAGQMQGYLAGAEMDSIEVDGISYIGYLSIPALDLELPVISEWSYPSLKISPARYIDSNQNHALIIAGHNYSRHFGKLNTLTVGDPIVFTDVHSQIYSFKVSEIQVLSSDDMDAMVSGDWDLTLFTCTYGGANRVTVRCVFDEEA